MTAPRQSVPVATAVLCGVEAELVHVDMALTSTLYLAGAPARTRETATRVRAALAASGYTGMRTRAPAMVATGAGADLAFAISALAGDGVIHPTDVAGVAFYGDLGLDGSIRAARGTLAAVEAAAAAGLRAIVIPAACQAEVAGLVPDITVYVATHLDAVIAEYAETKGTLGQARTLQPKPASWSSGFDLADVRGLPGPRWALEVAAAGGHDLALVGPPGIGKSMLARRLPSILPPLTLAQVRDVTRVYSAVGAVGERFTAPPFRAPHHTASLAAVRGTLGVGSARTQRPGEVALAIHGALFLDEAAEFSAATIDAAFLYRTTAQVILAVNPCPCGWADTGIRECACPQIARQRYALRVASIVDRCDITVTMPHVALNTLRDSAPGESSAVVRARVIAARAIQAARGQLNATLPGDVLRATCADCDADAVPTRTLRVARTIADLQGAADVTADHVTRAAELTSGAAVLAEAAS